MKRLLMGMIVAGCFMMPVIETASAFDGNVHVRGYTKQNGTYVQPYTRARPHRTGPPAWTPAQRNAARFKSQRSPYYGKAPSSRRYYGGYRR